LRGLPFFLFADNATTHAPLSLWAKFERENIIFLSFQPPMTHLLHPIDVSWAPPEEVCSQLSAAGLLTQMAFAVCREFREGQRGAEVAGDERQRDLRRIAPGDDGVSPRERVPRLRSPSVGPQPVLNSRLVTSWTSDPTVEGAEPELDDRHRRPKVFHYGSRELTSPETRRELQGFIAQRRERAINVRRRQCPDRWAMLADLDRDGVPALEGDDDDESGWKRNHGHGDFRR
jgi:hypothetical protein